jgi:endonuclease/exonuclease/phosphatase family metal-dependent hydrolase
MADHRGIVVRVVSWNLFHGRDYPPDRALFTWRSRLLCATERSTTHAQVNHPLREDFAEWLAARPWDVTLLQEAPPRWLATLGERCGANGVLALTSRNTLGRLRATLAEWNPDLIASGEGGSNQVLVRSPGHIIEVRRLTIARRPERRRMLWARLELPGAAPLCVANLHTTADDRAAAAREIEHAAGCAMEWSEGQPLIFGGDLNLKPRERPDLFESLAERHGFSRPTDSNAIDHLLSRGLEQVEPPRRLPPAEREVAGPDGLRVRLSDHAPVVAAFGMK